MLRPGDVIGVPAGVPDPGSGDVVVFRWLLMSLLLVCAVALARRRQIPALLAGLAFGGGAVGFWVLALGRPYGLLADPDITRRAATLAVASETGRPDESFVAGEPQAPAPAGRIAARLSRPTLLLAPTWLPVLLLPLSALALWRLARGEDGLLAALLWIAFSTGDLDTLRGAGFVPGLWARPVSSAAFLLLLALLAVLGRRLASPRIAIAAGLAAATAWILLGFRGHRLGPLDTLLMLTLDQGVWLLLGGWTLWRTRGGPAVTLCVSGGALALAGAAGLDVDAWAAQAFYRAGLLLAAIPAVREVSRTLGGWLTSGVAALRNADATALGGALLFGVGAVSSTLAWWDPPRWDVVVRESLDPLSPAVGEPMEWLRRQTPPDAVVLAAPAWAPSVAVLAGRRVLRAPTLLTAPDDERRRRLERAVLTGAPPPSRALLDRYGLRYVLAAPGDFQDAGIRAPHELAARPHLRLRHLSGEGFRVYEIVQ